MSRQSTASAGQTQFVRVRPRWLAPTSLVLVVIGLALSIYLTYEHFTNNATLACSIGGIVDCAKVTTSAPSVRSTAAWMGAVDRRTSACTASAAMRIASAAAGDSGTAMFYR